MQVDFTSLDPNVLITYGDGHPIDLYMYMRGENKYIKLTNNDEQVSIVVQKFKDKGLKEVFMLTSEFEEFVKSVRNQLQEKFKRKEKWQFRRTNKCSCQCKRSFQESYRTGRYFKRAYGVI